MTLLGIDGCKSGWCVATYRDHEFQIRIFPTIIEVVNTYAMPFEILIDIPIGLGDAKTIRDIDTIARKELAPIRHQSIFTPPTRNAVYAKTYEKAREINLSETGKKISIQSWNISMKIRELDTFIANNPLFRNSIHEAHPEICFKYLNDGKVIDIRKNAPGQKGIQERMHVLSRFDPQSMNYFERAVEELPSADVKKDDIVDAMCLAVTAKYGMKFGYSKIQSMNKMDTHGIEMSMHYYRQ